MATMAENFIAAGSETHPPMLEKGMYDSWKTRIMLYIRGKENGEMLRDSVEHGPYKFKSEITIKDTDGVSDIRREERLEDLKGDDKLRYDNDIKAIKILLLGLPINIYTLINHYQTANEISDRVKELMEGTEMTKYANLINDMNMIPMSMTTMQINTECVNHLQPEWSRFVTAAKQARDLYNSPPLQSYTPSVVQQTPTFQPDTKLAIPTFLPTDDQIASLNKAMIFLISAYSSKFPPTNNRLKTSFNPRTQATIQNDQVTVQNVQGENQPREFLADILEEIDDCEDLQLQATTNFKADHVDAYDSDYDDEATTNAIFMANVSLVDSLNDDTVSPRYDYDTLSEVPYYDTYHDSDVLNSNIQELGYIENIVSTNKSYDELKGNSDVISYTNYMLTIGDDADIYVPPILQKNDMMLSVIEQMKSQVENCNKKQLLINNNRLLEENIATDIMCTYLRSLNKVDNCGKFKSLDIVLLDLQESNKSLSELRKRFAKLKEYNITLDIAFQNHKEQMILNNHDTKNKQLLVKTINNQSVEINNLKVQVQDKLHVINELKHLLAQKTQCELPVFDFRIQKIEDENVSLAFQVSSLVKKREHIKVEYKNLYDSIKQTRAKMKVQTDSLQQELSDQISENNKLRAKLKGNFYESQTNHNGTSVNTMLSKPSTSGTKLYSVTLFPKSKELLVYVSASCPFTQSGNKKWAPATSHRKNNKPYIDASRTKQTIETITKEHIVKQNTRKTDNTILPSIGRVRSTNASRSKPKRNTKNDRIPQPSSRCKKNKVEAHHRKSKSSANKNNHVLDCNANDKNVALSKISDTICLSCNECLFSANHDACVFQYLKKMQKHKVAKFAKQKVKREWKPTGQIFKTVVVPPGHILTTTVIPVDAPCLKLIRRYANAWGSLSKPTIITECHPFNLHDFGFKICFRDEELPP
ncbi:hypothetical protein Tco_0592454 [Tanacetum coccineum]